jgi:hypothetical protein
MRIDVLQKRRSGTVSTDDVLVSVFEGAHA